MRTWGPWIAICIAAVAIAATLILRDASGSGRVDLHNMRMSIIFSAYLMILASVYLISRRKRIEATMDEKKISFLKLLIGSFVFAGIAWFLIALLAMFLGGPTAMSSVIGWAPVFIPVMSIISFPMVKKRMRLR